MMGSHRTLPAGVLLAMLGFDFAAFTVFFFRDPERPMPAGGAKIFSPADGVVMSVAREGSGPETTMRVFLSIFDVHIQRAPCAGTVTDVRVVEGSFAAAMKAEAKANARVILTLRPEGGRGALVVEQIAGLIARRIECWSKPGETLAAGQRYGLIYFGSQAAVHFPADAKCTVQPGERLAAGLSEIGEWTGKS